MIDFKAHKNKINEQMQMAWLNGYYTRLAIASSVFACGLADKKTIDNLPKYPEMPREQEEDEPLTQAQIDVQTQYFIAKMEHWTKSNNERFKNKE